MSRRSKRSLKRSDFAQQPAQVVAARHAAPDAKGTSPVPLVVLAFGVPLLLLIIGAVVMGMH
jgi:hypothetical protein